MQTETKQLVRVSPVARQTPMTNLTERGLYPNISKYISPFFDRFGKIKTGLTSEDAERLGKAIGQDLSPRSDFWHDFTIRLTSKDLYLDPSDPLDEIKLKLLRVHPDVANSTSDINPKTVFVLFDEVEEAKKESKKFDYIIEAYKHIADMSPNERRDFLKLFGYTKASMNMVDEAVKTKLKELADSDAKVFCERFDDKHKADKIFIEDLVAHNILRKNGAAYVYNDDVIGGNLELTIDYLKKPKNQPTLIALKAQLEEKRKFN